MMGKDNTANSIPNIPRPHLLRRKSIRTGVEKNLQKWLRVQNFSPQVTGTPLIPTKMFSTKLEHIHTVESFLSHNPNVGLIINFSAEPEPYTVDKKEVEYVQLSSRSKVLPTKPQIIEFLHVVDAFIARRPGASIGVHCHYGFNRTGFMTCCYIIHKHGISAHKAMERFKRARPPGIKHQHFREHLASITKELEKGAIMPALPQVLPRTLTEVNAGRRHSVGDSKNGHTKDATNDTTNNDANNNDTNNDDTNNDDTNKNENNGKDATTSKDGNECRDSDCNNTSNRDSGGSNGSRGSCDEPGKPSEGSSTGHSNSNSDSSDGHNGTEGTTRQMNDNINSGGNGYKGNHSNKRNMHSDQSLNPKSTKQLKVGDVNKNDNDSEGSDNNKNQNSDERGNTCEQAADDNDSNELNCSLHSNDSADDDSDDDDDADAGDVNERGAEGNRNNRGSVNKNAHGKSNGQQSEIEGRQADQKHNDSHADTHTNRYYLDLLLPLHCSHTVPEERASQKGTGTR